MNNLTPMKIVLGVQGNLNCMPGYSLILNLFILDTGKKVHWQIVRPPGREGVCAPLIPEN